MQWRYEDYDPSKVARKELLRRLKALYMELLLQADGDPEQALEWLAQLARRYRLFPPGFTLEDLKQALKRERLVAEGPQGLVLTAAGARALRQDSLERIFSNLGRDAAGDHRVASAGAGQERQPETRAYTFGDPVDLLDAAASVRNALRRGLPGDTQGLSLAEDDLEVYETEHLSSAATVLLLDLSHSMILYGEDRITPAKRVALALVELIRTKFPKDSLRVVCFGDEAWEVPLDDIPSISVGPVPHEHTRGPATRPRPPAARAAWEPTDLHADGRQTQRADRARRRGLQEPVRPRPARSSRRRSKRRSCAGATGSPSRPSC
jgi:Ca-activated chloride channel family protein